MNEYIRYFAQNPKEPFTIEISGKSWCDGNYRINRDCSRVWVLEYILEGKGTVRIFDGETKEYTPKAGDVYLLPQNSRHLYFSDEEEPWEKLFINCKGPVVEKLAEAYHLTGKIYFPDMQELEPYFQEIYAWMQDKALSDCYVLEQTELKLHQIFRLLWERTRNLSEENPDIARAKQYLDAHIGELVSIKELAAHIYRSPDYLIKHFKEETGITPYQYLLKRKMSIARKLLQDTVLSVKEVAGQLGYEDPQYFSGLFKKETGLPPGRFRKQQGS